MPGPARRGYAGRMRQEYVDAVLDLTSLIPPGQVLSYGDVAELLETSGPRQVGAVLARFGADTCWWRVIRSSGLPPQGHGLAAWRFYRLEGTPVAGRVEPDGGGYRVRMGSARWVPGADAALRMEQIRNCLQAAPAPAGKRPRSRPHPGGPSI